MSILAKLIDNPSDLTQEERQQIAAALEAVPVLTLQVGRLEDLCKDLAGDMGTIHSALTSSTTSFMQGTGLSVGAGYDAGIAKQHRDDLVKTVRNQKDRSAVISAVVRFGAQYLTLLTGA